MYLKFPSFLKGGMVMSSSSLVLSMCPRTKSSSISRGKVIGIQINPEITEAQTLGLDEEVGIS